MLQNTEDNLNLCIAVVSCLVGGYLHRAPFGGLCRWFKQHHPTAAGKKMLLLSGVNNSNNTTAALREAVATESLHMQMTRQCFIKSNNGFASDETPPPPKLVPPSTHIFTFYSLTAESTFLSTIFLFPPGRTCSSSISCTTRKTNCKVCLSCMKS